MNLTHELFDLSHSLIGPYLKKNQYPWQILPTLSDIIEELSCELETGEYHIPSEGIFVHKTASVAPTAYIGKGCIIGKNTQIRHGAFLRGNALIGEGCTVGNSTEIKNSVIFDGVQIPHYNYVGDSILGYRAHLGAGAVISNVKSDKRDITVRLPEGDIATGMRKLGAMVGDSVEIGCSCVINPGSVIMKNSNVYPLTSLRGFVPEGSIVKAQGVIVKKHGYGR